MALLGVNIDHVATVRNARGGSYPDPIRAALVAEEYGADGITAHLREDRRHMKDEDMFALKVAIATRLNMEMANTTEMVALALKLKPFMITLVPERREELTTEGGLDVVRHLDALKETVRQCDAAGILVSLFIDPDARQVAASKESGAGIIELHTGRYCEAFLEGAHERPLSDLMVAGRQAVDLGLEVNAGHGLTLENVSPVLALPRLNELNIGHSLIAEAIFTGLGPAVAAMKALIR
ncbi:MAG: pyridoxine 5'-phosphate synthase [Candidatus Melainabacteria bacterium]